MKYKITLTLFFLLFNVVYSQSNLEHITIAKPVNYYTKVLPPSIYKDRQILQKSMTGSLNIEYDANVPSDVRTAIDVARDIWNSLLKFNTQVTAKIEWGSLDPGVLGGSYPIAPIFYEDKYYPVSLANFLIGSDQNGTDPEIRIKFNSDFIITGNC